MREARAILLSSACLALAALGFAATIGAGSAAATALCTGATEEVEKAPPLMCKAEGQLELAKLAGTAKEGLKIETSSGNVECKTASFEATVEEGKEEEKEEEEPMPGVTTKTAFGECTSTIACKGAVTMTAKAPWTVNVTYDQTTSPEGHAALVHPARVVKLACFGAECEFAASSVVEGDLSNKAQTLAFVKEPVSVSGGFLCPKTGTETVTYGIKREGGVLAAGEEAAGAGEVQVASGGRAQFCLVAAVNGRCPNGQAYGGEVKGALLASHSIELTSGIGEVKCTQAPFKSTFSEGGLGNVTELEYKTCSSTIAGLKAEVRMNLPFDNTMLALENHTVYALVRKSSNKPEFELETNGGEPCAYLQIRPVWRWHFEASTFSYSSGWSRLSGPGACPAFVSHDGALKIETATGGALRAAAR